MESVERTREPAREIEGRFNALDFVWNDKELGRFLWERIREQHGVFRDGLLYDRTGGCCAVDERAVWRCDPDMPDRTSAIPERERAFVESETRASWSVESFTHIRLVDRVAGHMNAHKCKHVSDERGTAVRLGSVIGRRCWPGVYAQLGARKTDDVCLDVDLQHETTEFGKGLNVSRKTAGDQDAPPAVRNARHQFTEPRFEHGADP